MSALSGKLRAKFRTTKTSPADIPRAKTTPALLPARIQHPAQNQAFNNFPPLLPPRPEYTHHTVSESPAPSSLPDTQIPPNPTIYQSFEWYTPSTPSSPNSHYSFLTRQLPILHHLGITHLHLTPGCKAANRHGNGYDIYDLWDLGQFLQKGSVPTKWGDYSELLLVCEKARELGVGVIWDAVLNHRAGGDFVEEVEAVRVHKSDRRREVGERRVIGAWTGFEFEGRGGVYSDVVLRKEDFNAVNWDDWGREEGIWKFCGSEWAGDVDGEFGGYDFLMFNNLTYTAPRLAHDTLAWSHWITNHLHLSGFRLDALKHMSLSFIRRLLQSLHATNPSFLFLGEYWKFGPGARETLISVIDTLEGRCKLYDVQLFYNFADFSVGKRRDLRRWAEGSLLEKRPGNTVTVVGTHDTQRTQTLFCEFEEWFLPHAYCLTLLRDCASLPCVFHGHLYGVGGPEPSGAMACLGALVLVRRHCAYGGQVSYFDEKECIGWTRQGNEEEEQGCIVVLSISSTARKWKTMFLGRQHSGRVFRDIVGGGLERDIKVGKDGWVTCGVKAKGAGVWLRMERAVNFSGVKLWE